MMLRQRRGHMQLGGGAAERGERDALRCAGHPAARAALPRLPRLLCGGRPGGGRAGACNSDVIVVL